MDKTPKVDVKQLPQLRTNATLLQLQNPNYFGNITDPVISKKYIPVVILGEYNTYYEQLECIGYSPETQTLGAVVNIKQESGYDGNLCVGGSREYIRFYLDYNRTGEWVDAGITNFSIYDHSIPDTLSYYADITLEPEQLACCQNSPILPRVRAILSWNTPPPANSPNFPPVWGNVLEADIQLAPSHSIWCYIIDTLTERNPVKLDPSLLQPGFADKYLPALSDISVDKAPLSPTPVELKKAYGKSVPDARIALSSISRLKKSSDAISPALLDNLLPGFNLGEIFPVLTNPGFDTSWEELGCVGLDRDESQLNATVLIRQTLGYNGSLCTAGSNEYVAFYMDFGGGWIYMGTSSVAVHDIPRTTGETLVYDVSLSVNLDSYRQAWCSVGKAKVLAILSWNIAPTPNDPNYTSVFGDSKGCVVEIRPLPIGVQPDEIVPFIEMVGGMVDTDIDQTSGLATTSGGSASVIIGADSSPFYGRILITGHIFNAPFGTMYRLKIHTPGSPLSPLLNSQSVQTDTSGAISAPITLTPTLPNPTDGGGWMPYLAIGTNISIVNNLLGIYNTPTGADGIYTIAIDMMDAAGHITAGNSVNFYVNSEFQVPAIDITTGAGNCASFGIGNSISGTFSMTHTKFAGSLDLVVTPNNGAVVSIVSNPQGSLDSLSYRQGTLSTDGAPILPGESGNTGYFNIDTSHMTVCGYNITIGTLDRTIINSVGLGAYEDALRGFCLING